MFPVEARQIELGCNRKRGRPRKTKPALKYQEEIEYCESNDLGTWAHRTAYDLPVEKSIIANQNATDKPSTSKASQPTTTPSKSIFKAKVTRSNPKRGCNTSN